MLIYNNVRNRKNKPFCKFILFKYTYRTCLTKTTDEAGEAGACVAINDVIARGPVLTRVGGTLVLLFNIKGNRKVEKLTLILLKSHHYYEF